MREFVRQAIVLAIALSVPGIVRATDSWEVITQRCKAGSLDDCNRLGTYHVTRQMNEPGANSPDAIARDYKEAERFYTMACDGGDAVGCYQLGFLCTIGELHGVTGGQARAHPLYKKACDGGSAEGCSNLATDYESGYGVAKNTAVAAAYNKKAASLFQKGCDQGDSYQCTRSAFHLDRAAGLYREACQGGDKSSCDALIRLRSHT